MGLRLCCGLEGSVRMMLTAAHVDHGRFDDGILGAGLGHCVAGVLGDGQQGLLRLKFAR